MQCTCGMPAHVGYGHIELLGERPICNRCGRAIPEYLEAQSLLFPCTGLCFCGPCLWDGYTPQWREHAKHTASYADCQECGMTE